MDHLHICDQGCKDEQAEAMEVDRKEPTTVVKGKAVLVLDLSQRKVSNVPIFFLIGGRFEILREHFIV